VCQFVDITLMRSTYLDAAASAATLLGDPAVAAAWESPSALPQMPVSGLAGHLANQIFSVPVALAAPVPDDERITLLDHYARAAWLGTGVDSEANVAIRNTAEGIAADGPAALAQQVTAVVDFLRADLPAEPARRIVRLPWVSWSLRLDDFLVTRMMEIAVHSDDLAVSVGVDTPPLPDPVLVPVLNLLSALAVRRHGQAAVLRAFSRAERAPADITAF
jgi:hypothetical protein